MSSATSSSTRRPTLEVTGLAVVDDGVSSIQTRGHSPSICSRMSYDSVIGGSFARGSIQGEYLARGNLLGNRDLFVEMANLVDHYPLLLGIGVDELSAIEIKTRR